MLTKEDLISFRAELGDAFRQFVEILKSGEQTHEDLLKLMENLIKDTYEQAYVQLKQELMAVICHPAIEEGL